MKNLLFTFVLLISTAFSNNAELDKTIPRNPKKINLFPQHLKKFNTKKQALIIGNMIGSFSFAATENIVLYREKYSKDGKTKKGDETIVLNFSHNFKKRKK